MPVVLSVAFNGTESIMRPNHSACCPSLLVIEVPTFTKLKLIGQLFGCRLAQPVFIVGLI